MEFTSTSTAFSWAATALSPRQTPIPPLLPAEQQETILNAVLMRGGATHQELLQMQFGEWPPRGLQTNKTATYEMIPIRDLLTDYPEYRDTKTTGLAGPDKDGKQTVWFKEGYRNFYSTGHEAAHIAQRRTCTLPQCCQGLMTSYLENSVGPTMDKIMEQAETPEQTADRRKLQFTSADGGGMRNYYSQETEIQAWMDNVLSHAYHTWGQLPTTTMELWAGLHNANILTPPPIHQEIHSTAEGQEALKLFPTVAPITGYKAYRDINSGFSFLPEEQQVAVWREVFPRVYAGLIESYGDELGRERMGLGKSVAEERAIALAIDHNDPTFDFAEAAKKIAPENADQLIEHAQQKGHTAALDALNQQFPKAKESGEAPKSASTNILVMPEVHAETEAEQGYCVGGA